ncbi:type I 3-dehydroquinate dehydratase [Halorubrum sp. CBA1125]|uniref:type I 3-dehydroquinate dehydratase n=1 Tax=Halorubrum sp. CBA1125 TaxID=2668072 RepID=UPI0012E723D9|nr:type I 3-dehydroquinate dehydratase [Halorubrum sp. CBA1125]MUW14565.1 type I 3-dehydroquinate dehydratase [Halorubrum sp. CBA1125]
MDFESFALAATTDDLTREPEARGLADVVEFRMDKADDPLAQLDDYDGELPLIATNRTRWFGGQAVDTGRLDRLSAASRSESVEVVDVELETARSTEWILDELRENGVDCIVSHHTFEDTPERDILDAIFRQCGEYGDVAKVATFPERHTDVLRLLRSVATATRKGTDVAGIAMGRIGSHSRAVAPIYGSKLGYAPLAADESKYAPGQIPLERLRSLVDGLTEESEIQRADAPDDRSEPRRPAER